MKRIIMRPNGNARNTNQRKAMKTNGEIMEMLRELKEAEGLKPEDKTKRLREIRKEMDATEAERERIASHWGWNLAIVVFAFPLLLWQSFVLSTLWGWFAAPLGAPHIGVWLMGGLMIIHGVALRRQRRDDVPGMHRLRSAFWMAVTYAFALLFGWICSLGVA